MNYVCDSKLCAKLVLRRNYHYNRGNPRRAPLPRLAPLPSSPLNTTAHSHNSIIERNNRGNQLKRKQSEL